MTHIVAKMWQESNYIDFAFILKVGNDSMRRGIDTQQKLQTTSKTEATLDYFMKKKLRLVVIFIIMIVNFMIAFLPFAVGR